MMPALDEIEQKIRAALNQLDEQWKSLGDADAAWTRAIKNSVGRIGESLGFEVYAMQCDFEENGEWLFDLTWLNENGEFVLEFPLALESEWRPKGILDDFQKLLVSRAEHRVMVFWQRSADAYENCLDQLIGQIAAYHGTLRGDRYLFCCWIESLDKLRIRLHVAGEAA